jgi:hypothetical protein
MLFVGMSVKMCEDPCCIRISFLSYNEVLVFIFVVSFFLQKVSIVSTDHRLMCHIHT